MKENDLAYKVIGLAIEVHNVLGPGLLESAYQECLFYKIEKEYFEVRDKIKSIDPKFFSLIDVNIVNLHNILENSGMYCLYGKNTFSSIWKIRAFRLQVPCVG